MVSDLLMNDAVEFIMSVLTRARENQTLLMCLTIFNALSDCAHAKHLVINDSSIDLGMILDKIQTIKDQSISRTAFRLMVNLMGSDRPRKSLLDFSSIVVPLIADFLSNVEANKTD